MSKGPYASAILRFNIKFPPSYPELPPLVTFTTDIFHPLIVPLTTYTFTTGSSNEAPVSATDEERLSPGAFSLRHGFPHWFGRAQRTASNSVTASRNVSGGSVAHEVQNGKDTNQANSRDIQSNSPAPDISSRENGDEPTPGPSTHEAPLTPTDTARISRKPAAAPYKEEDTTVHVLTLLNYIRSTFDDETILDSLPLDAAGNPGAWHAWKAHRRSVTGAGLGTPDRKGAPQARLPGEWNWEGVWAKRVQNGIQASQSDAALYATAPRMETDSVSNFHGLRDVSISANLWINQIRFLHLDCNTMQSIKDKMISELTEEVRN